MKTPNVAAVEKYASGLRIQSTVMPKMKAPQARGQRGDRVRADGGEGDGDPFIQEVGQLDQGQGNYFEALRDSKERTSIEYAAIHLNPQILRLINGLNRKLLACVGRYLVDNTSLAKNAVGLMTNYSCPVKSHSLIADKDIAKAHDDYFIDWEENCDFTRRYTFEQLQRIICKAVDTDGDIGATMNDSAGFPQVRLFDTFHVGNLAGLDPKDGVDIDDMGRCLGYEVMDGPVDTLTSTAQKFIPVNQMILLFDEERYSNYRGFSAMRGGANHLRDHGDILAFQKTKEKIGASLAAWINQNGPLEEDDWGEDTKMPLNPNKTQMRKKISLAQLFGGDIPVIDGELKQFLVQDSGENIINFCEYLSGLFVAGMELPMAFFLDEKLTGPNVRSVLGKVVRTVDQRKKIIKRFVRFTRLRVIADGMVKGLIPAAPNWWKFGFQFPALVTIDLGDQMSNERADVLCGQMSEKRRMGYQGLDDALEHDQITTEIDRKIASAVALQQKYKSANIPIEMILARMGFGTLSMRASFMDAQQETQNNQNKNNPAQQPPNPPTHEDDDKKKKDKK